jgi:hypothetical protein
MFPLTTNKDRIALIVGFAALLAQPAVKAQGVGTAVVANIPFAFQVGSEHLPAGTYRIELQGSDFLWVKGRADSGVMIVMRESANRPSTDSAVVFHHYGNEYFLREVRTAGSEDRLWTEETKAEHRAKVELAAANPNSGPREDSKVEVALLAPPR